MRRARAVAIVVSAAVCAGVGVAILSHRSSGPAPRVMPTPGGVRASLADAQRRAPFVIYLPTALPPDAGQPRFMFVPELESQGEYLPSCVYVNYPNGITLWEMPSRGRPLARTFVPVLFGDRVGWGRDGPGPRRVSLEWIQGGTQLGLSAPLPAQEVFKIAGSAVQAAPNVTMASPSLAQQRNWGLPASLPGSQPGGIGVFLTPGMPGVIMSVEPGAPAARAGLRAGDQILTVNDRAVARLSEPVLTSLLRGKSGTIVRLAVSRSGRAKPTEVILRRQPLPGYDTQEMTLAEARAKMPFRLLAPQWVPAGYRLLGVSVLTREGRPLQARLLYGGAAKPLLLIRELAAQEAGFSSTASRAQHVTINGAKGLLAADDHSLSLAWIEAGTAVVVQSSALDRAAALKIARAME